MKTKHKIAYINCAIDFADCSVGKRLQVGAIVTKKGGGIIAEGYNGLPTHMNGPLEDFEGNTKPDVRHAEKNALMKLTRSHESSVDSVMFCTHSCCYNCAVDIVDAGVSEFYFKNVYRNLDGILHLLSVGVKVYQMNEDGKDFSRLLCIGDDRITKVSATGA